MQSQNQTLELPLLTQKNISLVIKREDLLHPFLSGNKYRKLKYNVATAKAQGHTTMLTFGGAYSNHITATAFAGMEQGMKTIGVIRGEELQNKWQENPTLIQAHKHGMQFRFVTREQYKSKEGSAFIKELQAVYGNFYLVPEGGTNALAIKGCEEILTAEDTLFHFVCTCVGTGGTLAGLCNAATEQQRLIGFSALKGDFLQETVGGLTTKNNWELRTDFHFGGYAKVTSELINFINTFKAETGIPLDPVYTGKMMFGLFHMIKNDNFVAGTKILAIHTGGLQGIAGMNTLLEKKNLPQLML